MEHSFSPANPENPHTPANPENLDISANPDNPYTPANPENPYTPANPDNPYTPGNLDNPFTPGNPDQSSVAIDPIIQSFALLTENIKETQVFLQSDFSREELFKSTFLHFCQVMPRNRRLRELLKEMIDMSLAQTTQLMPFSWFQRDQILPPLIQVWKDEARARLSRSKEARLCWIKRGTATEYDFSTLKGKVWLNDEVINEYIGLLRKAYPETMFATTHFRKHTKGYKVKPRTYTNESTYEDRDINWASLTAWGQILIPDGDGVHWTFVRLIHENPPTSITVQHYDSSNIRDPTPELKASLETAFAGIPLNYVDGISPDQHDGHSCGVFTLLGLRLLGQGSQHLSQDDADLIIPNMRERILAEILAGALDPTEEHHKNFLIMEELAEQKGETPKAPIPDYPKIIEGDTNYVDLTSPSPEAVSTAFDLPSKEGPSLATHLKVDTPIPWDEICNFSGSPIPAQQQIEASGSAPTHNPLSKSDSPIPAQQQAEASGSAPMYDPFSKSDSPIPAQQQVEASGAVQTNDVAAKLPPIPKLLSPFEDFDDNFTLPQMKNNIFNFDSSEPSLFLENTLKASESLQASLASKPGKSVAQPFLFHEDPIEEPTTLDENKFSIAPGSSLSIKIVTPESQLKQEQLIKSIMGESSSSMKQADENSQSEPEDSPINLNGGEKGKGKAKMNDGKKGKGKARVKKIVDIEVFVNAFATKISILTVLKAGIMEYRNRLNIGNQVNLATLWAEIRRTQRINQGLRYRWQRYKFSELFYSEQEKSRNDGYKGKPLRQKLVEKLKCNMSEWKGVQSEASKGQVWVKIRESAERWCGENASVVFCAISCTTNQMESLANADQDSFIRGIERRLGNEPDLAENLDAATGLYHALINDKLPLGELRLDRVSLKSIRAGEVADLEDCLDLEKPLAKLPINSLV
ncbi:unnamed protein product [Sphagnum balticum]